MLLIKSIAHFNLFKYITVYICILFIHIIGIFFVLPCTDTFRKVDLRTVTFDIPAQEVRIIYYIVNYVMYILL